MKKMVGIYSFFILGRAFIGVNTVFFTAFDAYSASIFKAVHIYFRIIHGRLSG